MKLSTPTRMRMAMTLAIMKEWRTPSIVRTSTPRNTMPIFWPLPFFKGAYELM